MRILLIFNGEIQLQTLKKCALHEWNTGTMEYWRIQIPAIHVIFVQF